MARSSCFFRTINFMLFIFTCPIMLNAEQKLSLIADEISYGNSGNLLKAKGNVIIKYSGYTLTTPQLVYNKNTGIISASNPIELRTMDKLQVLATAAEVSDDFKTMFAKHANVLIDQQFFVKSKNVKKTADGHSTFYSSVGTTCKICPTNSVPMWQIKSEKISHNPSKRKLIFRNAWMELLGIPVLYTPYLQMPEPGVKRATGLLTPQILTSNLLGVGMKQPFYLRLDKSSDLTISVVKTTKTNLLIETEYRKLLTNGKLQLAGAAKPRSGESLVDGYFEINGEAKLFKNSNFIFDITAVSDSGFLGRYGYSDTDRLTSKISLNAQGDRNFSEISATYFTSFRDNSQNEYIVAPNFFTRYYRNIHPLDLSTGVEISLLGLTKQNLDNKLRFSTSIDATKEYLLNRGFKLKGSSKLSANLYKSNNSISIYEEKFLKKYDSTIALEMSAPFFKAKNDRLDVIKPTLQLIYNPSFKINDEIENLDSQQVKLDQTSLFSLNRFSGLDKQEYGLRLNSGIEYNVKGNGPFSYDLAFGQIFRQTPSSQFSETSGLSGIKSDILISGNVTYNSLINLHGQQLYDENFNLKQAETTLVLTQDDKKLSSGLIFLDNDNHQNTSQRLSELTLGLESDLSKNWTTNLDLRRNLNANENINAALSFEYENECSKINLSFSRRFTETNSLPADTRIELSFDLNGLRKKKTSMQKSNCVFYN